MQRKFRFFVQQSSCQSDEGTFYLCLQPVDDSSRYVWGSEMQIKINFVDKIKREMYKEPSKVTVCHFVDIHLPLLLQ